MEYGRAQIPLAAPQAAFQIAVALMNYKFNNFFSTTTHDEKISLLEIIMIASSLVGLC